MAKRVERVVGTRPRRRVGLGALVAVLAAVAVLVVAGVFTAAPSAKTDHTTQSSSQSGLTPQQQAASNFVNGLLSRMTVAEKFGQLEMAGPGTPTGSDLIPLAQSGQIGSVLDLTGVDNINAVQKAALHSRLHIPLIFSLDVIHGYKTMYPISLGESSSWDPALAHADASMAAAEGAADGIKWTFSPMVDVTRDPRWGRVQGTSGEDPFLGAALAAVRIHGYQGANYSNPNKMAATIKHFAA
ncbi:MAG: glycoside hydrolase family 3 N-terminal domain-containing protein, partial [Solirubrobacteraceae bacterium]